MWRTFIYVFLSKVVSGNLFLSFLLIQNNWYFPISFYTHFLEKVSYVFFSLEPLLKVEKRITEISWGKGKLELVKGVLVCEIFRVRLNYATTHQDTPPSTTIQNISTTTYHHPPPAKICPPPCTTTHHQPKYIHHHPPPAKI